MPGPYLITTRRLNYGMDAIATDASSTRLAVVSLDDQIEDQGTHMAIVALGARSQAVTRACAQRASLAAASDEASRSDKWDDAYHAIRAIPAEGGSVPLPDGTTIDVEPTTFQALRVAIPREIAQRYPTVIPAMDVCDVFNAAQEVRS